jgi:predicted GH43/DUF377 family glycosyl hydrolase
LVIYHGNQQPSQPGEVGAYCAGALLLDRDDPNRILMGTPDPFMLPEADFETSGFVANVVFPTGIVENGLTVLVYYGAADSSTGVVEYAVADLLAAMRAEN